MTHGLNSHYTPPKVLNSTREGKERNQLSITSCLLNIDVLLWFDEFFYHHLFIENNIYIYIYIYVIDEYFTIPHNNSYNTSLFYHSFLHILEPKLLLAQPSFFILLHPSSHRKNDCKQSQMSVYPKVKVRQEPLQEDADVRDLGLKSFLSLSSPVMDKKNVIGRSIVKVPKCYVPHVPTPRVHVTEDFGDCSLSSDSSGSTETEKDGNTDEDRLHIRAGPIPRPRAVISSPDNDILMGPKNKIKDGRLSTTKNGAVLQNRHAQCKVKSHEVTDTPPDTRKSKEPESNDKIDPIRKKKVHKGSIKSEKVPRNWKF